MVYILENTEHLGEAFLQASEKFISQQRWTQLQEYALTSDKVNSSAAYMLLRYGLKREYGIEEKPLLEYRHRGKPYLKDTEGIFFNISHCKNAIACILSERDTAVDVMDIRKVTDGTIRRSCTPQERMALSGSNSRERDFIRLWTRKECYAKLDGRGLLLDFSKIDDSLAEMKEIHTLEYKNYLLSYYGEKDMAIIKICTEELFAQLAMCNVQ